MDAQVFGDASLVSFESGVALLTLTALEIVLGIDNIVFIAILTGRLDPAVQARARRLGLFLAMFMRIALLFAITWVMRLTAPLVEVLGQEVSGRDLILLLGGLFLIGKATYEIHERIEGAGVPGEARALRRVASFGAVIVQVVLLDIVFSLDSVITAVGMARRIEVMVAAVVVAVGVMMVFAEGTSHFIEKHPTLKMLALAFLILIGVMLVAEGFEKHINRGYIYFAMAFSLGVEFLNIKSQAHGTPAKAHTKP